MAGSKLLLGVLACLGAAASTAVLGCRSAASTAPPLFADSFDRHALGADWLDTGKSARIEDGRLVLARSRNHPVWLQHPLPRDLQIDFDARSAGPAGDLKVELCGDGRSFVGQSGDYRPTGYEIVMGGWDNSRSMIARMGERDDAIKAALERKGDAPLVAPGRTYHFTLIHRGRVIEWKVDDRRYLTWTDPVPLEGEGHAYFGFNAWDVEVSFDNLSIRPAPRP